MANHEKRTRPRVAVDAAATLQVLGTSQADHGAPIPVRVSDASERGMRVHSNVAINSGVAIRLDIGEAMFLGEVCYCAPVADSTEPRFHIGIVTEQCLTGLSGLRHLISALEPEETHTGKTRRMERV